MISFIRGIARFPDKNNITIDVSGVGYDVRVTSEDRCALDALHNTEVMLHTVFILKQEGVELFGFLRRGDRELFNILNKINGVGGKIALTLLNNNSKKLIKEAMTNCLPLLLTELPGIGKKLAEKIFLECKHNKSLLIHLSHAEDFSNNTVITDTLSALVNLGVNRGAALKTVQQVVGDDPQITLSDAIKKALTSLHEGTSR